MVSAEDSSLSSSSSDVVDWNSSEIEDRTVSDFSVSGVAEAVGEQLLDFRMARFIAKSRFPEFTGSILSWKLRFNKSIFECLFLQNG